MSQTFRPLAGYILVKPIQRLQSRVLEVISKEKYSRGLVVAVGPGERLKNSHGQETYRRRAMLVSPGDFVTLETVGLYPEIELDGARYRIHEDKDVAFISERESIDQHNAMTDDDLAALLYRHREAA